MPRSSDIRIEAIEHSYEDFVYRTPIKFGGVALDRVTVLNVKSRVRTVGGKTAAGFGSMPLSNVWAFPSKTMKYDQTLAAMKALTENIAKLTGDCKEIGHPIDLTWTLEPAYMKADDEVSKQLGLTEPIPPLCTLVVGSAFDAALHDAFGKAHGLNC